MFQATICGCSQELGSGAHGWEFDDIRGKRPARQIAASVDTVLDDRRLLGAAGQELLHGLDRV